MGLLSRLREQQARETSLREDNAIVGMTTEDWYWGRASASGSEEDYFWRRLSDNWTQKDVLPGTYLEIHNQVYEAYNANPMANAIIEMGTNFVLGDGLRIDAPNKKVQRLIHTFWTDPDNRMDVRQFDLATELALYGELFVRVFVNPYSGHVKIAQLDPSLVDQIECDPDNIEHQRRIHRRPIPQTVSAPNGTVSIAPPDGTKGENQGVWYSIPDEVYHFAVNKVSNAKRGKSDLATLLPWLRRYKDWLIDRVRINKYKAAFLWDVQLTGADRKTIEARAMDLARPPEPGSVNIHNESEVWTAVQPRIDATNASADGQAIKLMVAMGAGIPMHFLSEGGDVNRATAAEMDLPTLKRFQRRQDYLKHILRTLIDRVIAEAQRAGTLPKGVDTSYDIIFPDLTADDSKDIGTSAYYMSQALATMTASGLVSHQTATTLFFHAARAEIDTEEEQERIDRERAAALAQGLTHPTPITLPQNGGPLGGPTVNPATTRTSVRHTGAPTAGLDRPDRSSA